VKKNWLLVIGVSLIVITLVSVGCDTVFPSSDVSEELTSGNIILSQQSTGIWVTGEGKVSVTPDVAILNLGVEAQAETVAEARQQAAGAMEAVMGELDKQGVAEEDIKTQYFSIYPVRRWDDDEDEEILVGYRVSNVVTAEIRKVDDAATIIDAVVVVGGDYTRIDSISFTVDDPTEYYGEIRGLAMDDAKAKAEHLAELAGVSLGKPTYISESSISPPVPREIAVRDAGFESASTTSISPGETEIQLNIQVGYSIE
jgi:uncharacterized protein YggE